MTQALHRLDFMHLGNCVCVRFSFSANGSTGVLFTDYV